jgi:NAD(P)-dependent dehydrogenase (short-subunit alcohol dehydrogenase family)
MKAVVITGVSSGIGWGTAKVLLHKGYQVFGSVRKQADADRLVTEFGANFVPLIFDVTDQGAVRHAADQVRVILGGHTLRGLVNNAGVALGGPLMYQPLAEYRSQIEVNLIGPFIVTQAFAPLLGMDRSLAGAAGRIVNISSVGGKFAGPFLGAYHAAKFGLEGFSDTLRRELMLFGIDVVVIGPGGVATAIWDKAEAQDDSAYERTEYATAVKRFRSYMIQQGRTSYAPERIGEVVWHALTVSRPRVRYAVVPHRLTNWIQSTLLPKRLMDRIIARNLGFNKA